ncbi:MAG: DMT family transporter [Burkholderiaceae bacterium]|nr:MAG: DMT family transporter [Burkholderiaceae bacterium]
MQSLWMLAAAFLFATMGVCVKLALVTLNVWEIVFYRNLVGLLILLPLLMRAGGLQAGLTTPHWRIHITRNVTGTLAVVLWFSSMAVLPLPTSMTLNYTSSLFIAALMLAQARQQRAALPARSLLLSLLAGFAGIVLVLRPTLTSGQWPWALIGLASGVFAAQALLTVRALGRLGEPETRTVFYFSISGLIGGGAGMLLTGTHPLDTHALLLLAGIGVTAVLAQLAITRAYGYGRTLLAANLNYSGILFASFYSVLLWNDRMPWMTVLGMLLIVISGAYATWRSMQRQ